jgi:2-polyprenyl-3-methyl-5-hydroxy-6-metoxy-1,4-benzoquinol methylase
MRTERWIDVFPVQRCLACGFLQTGRILQGEALEGFYAEDYGGRRLQQGQAINAAVNMRAVGSMGLTRPMPGRVLDVGCGYGFFLDLARRAGARVAGVELAKAEAAYARERLGLNVAGSLDELPLDSREGFDLVTLFEVVEHLHEPVEFVGELARLLRPGGVLVIATDNFASLPARVLGDGFPKWIPHQHVSLFDPASLQALVRAVGNLELVGQRSFTPWELLVRAGAHRLSRGRAGGRRYELERELGEEMTRPYRLYPLRRLINTTWFRMTSRPNLNGEMMFVAARRTQ